MPAAAPPALRFAAHLAVANAPSGMNDVVSSFMMNDRLHRRTWHDWPCLALGTAALLRYLKVTKWMADSSKETARGLETNGHLVGIRTQLPAWRNGKRA